MKYSQNLKILYINVLLFFLYMKSEFLLTKILKSFQSFYILLFLLIVLVRFKMFHVKLLNTLKHFSMFYEIFRDGDNINSDV